MPTMPNTETPKFQTEVTGPAPSESFDFQEAYRDAVNFLDDNFAYFLTHVLNIGKPRLVGGIPTAAVAVADKSKNVAEDFEFIFNPHFAEGLNTEELAFILAHETMHVLLNHLQMARNVKRFKEDGMRWNIAADAVINDYLVSQMGLVPPEGLIRGENVVGYNCANSCVSDVFNDLEATPENDEGGDCESCDGDGEEKDANGNGTGQPCPDCNGTGKPGGYPGRQIDDHDWMHKGTEQDEKAVEKASQGDNLPDDLKRTKDDDNFKSGMNPGTGVGSAQAFSELKGVGLKWADLLKKVNPFVYKKGPRPRPSWHRRPRKLSAFPEVYLPVKKRGLFDEGGTKPAIVMALDTSGSISREDANEFVNMARSVPTDKIKLFVCTFTTQYKELDLENPQWDSGGTHFDCISQYIEDVVQPQNKKKYPKAVIVITDGYANFSNRKPNKDEAKGWYWLLTNDGAHNYGEVLPGEVGKLADYRKGGK